MSINRRTLLKGAASAAGVTVLPFPLRADGHSPHEFDTGKGPLKVLPIRHASIVLQTPAGTIYVDPVGDPILYSGLPPADLILVTHHHGDHFNAETLGALIANGNSPKLVTNPEVMGKLPSHLASGATSLANGDGTKAMDVPIDAIPAYNLTADRQKFHPKGRDNGYVFRVGNFKIYVSGDTEDIPEMRGLADVDLAFVCMNLPFTMDATAAASAVAEFKPKYVYPYHFRGRDGGTQDPKEFAALVGDASDVRMGSWY